MKKMLSIVAVLLMASTSFGQQGEKKKAEQKQQVSEQSQTNQVQEQQTEQTQTQEVTQEKEITAQAGEEKVVLFNDGEFDYAPAGVKFVIEAKDEGSGVKNIYFSVNGGPFAQYSDPIALTKEGKNSIIYRVVDYVGNVSPDKTYSVVMDFTPPEVFLNPSQNFYVRGDKLFASSNYTYSFSAVDNLSGVKAIYYKVDDGDYSEVKDVVKLEAKGSHTISFKAEDNVGNESKEKSVSVVVDGDAPVVEIVPSVKPFEKDGVKFFGAGVSFSVSAKDSGSGVAKILVAVDSDEFSVYTTPVYLPAGKHKVRAKAVDNVGNESEEVVYEAVIDVDSPTAKVKPSK